MTMKAPSNRTAFRQRPPNPPIQGSKGSCKDRPPCGAAGFYYHPNSGNKNTNGKIY